MLRLTCVPLILTLLCALRTGGRRFPLIFGLVTRPRISHLQIPVPVPVDGHYSLNGISRLSQTATVAYYCDAYNDVRVRQKRERRRQDRPDGHGRGTTIRRRGTRRTRRGGQERHCRLWVHVYVLLLLPARREA
ncbi:hypothetical protein C8Q77DRAFT_1119913 [Trametes polyzona]|nr:hypothetical protein C8Q77DRAFT_1119913 [Trametes polyzona]